MRRPNTTGARLRALRSLRCTRLSIRLAAPATPERHVQSREQVGPLSSRQPNPAE